VVVYCLPESDPDIENAQTAANSANEATGKDVTQTGVGKKKVVVGPLRPPGHDYQEDADARAQEYKEQYRNAVQPERDARIVGIHFLSYLQSGWGKSGGRNSTQWRIGIRGHAALLACAGDMSCGADLRRAPVEKRPIATFYDFRAFMRSATSR
jgi:hypothetical protein